MPGVCGSGMCNCSAGLRASYLVQKLLVLPSLCHSHHIDRVLFPEGKDEVKKILAIAFRLSKVKCCTHLPDFLSGAHHENPQAF